MEIMLKKKQKRKRVSPDMIMAYDKGGYREKYAMDNGNKSVRYENGRELWVFTYSKSTEYQDANGATWDNTEKRWVN